MDLRVDIQVASGDDDEPPPGSSLERWLRAALEPRLSGEAEVSLRVVGAAESQRLNRDYRGKDAPTNVLSFPVQLPEGIPLQHLGDMVACAPVIHREAREQGKNTRAHWAHMMVHGALHLLGYDHQTRAQAAAMEPLEVAILSELAFANPYEPSPATQL